MKLAVVVQRYGNEVNGGAELEARMVTQHIAPAFEQVEVITTTARDYITWQPHYPPGTDDVNGIAVRRFDVDKPRNITRFDLLRKFVMHVAHPPFLEEKLLREQGALFHSPFAIPGPEPGSVRPVLCFTRTFTPPPYGVCPLLPINPPWCPWPTTNGQST